jgi:hypothetical protein
MEDIYSIIFERLSTRDYLKMRCVNMYFNNYICDNTCGSLGTIRIKTGNISLLKNSTISNVVYDANLTMDATVTNDDIRLLSCLTSLTLQKNEI